MQQDTAMPFPHPQCTAEDPFTAILRQGAQRLLAPAIEVEVTLLFAQEADRRATQGRPTRVRNGSLPEREGHTGMGAVRVKVPRGRDRRGAGLRLHAALFPPSRGRPAGHRVGCTKPRMGLTNCRTLPRYQFWTNRY